MHWHVTMGTMLLAIVCLILNGYLLLRRHCDVKENAFGKALETDFVIVKTIEHIVHLMVVIVAEHTFCFLDQKDVLVRKHKKLIIY